MEERDKEILNLFTMAIQQLAAEIDKFSCQGETLGQGIFIIDLVGNNQQCNMKEIVKILGIPASTATRWVDKLVQGGFVQRQTPDSNRRSVELSLTPKGQEAFLKFYLHRNFALKTVLNEFSNEEINVFVKILRKFIQAAR